MTSSDVTFHLDSPKTPLVSRSNDRPQAIVLAKSAECFLSTHETTAFPNGIGVYRWLCEASRRAHHLPRARRERLSTIDEAQIKAFVREFDPQPFLPTIADVILQRWQQQTGRRDEQHLERSGQSF